MAVTACSQFSVILAFVFLFQFRCSLTSRFQLATLVFARRRAAADLKASPFVMSKGQVLNEM